MITFSVTSADDLDDLGFAVARALYRGDVGVAYLAAGLGDLDREAHGGGGFGVGRGALAVERGVFGRDLGEIEADISVRRQAIIAAVSSATAIAMRSRVFTSEHLGFAAARPSRPPSAAGLRAKTRKRLGTTPSFLDSLKQRL